MNDENLEENNVVEIKEEEKMASASENIQRALKRSEYANMMQVGDNTFIRMGKGLSEYKKSMNGQKEDYQWIHEDSPSHEVENYAPSYDGTLKCFKNEPLFEYLFPLYKSRAIGAKAHIKVADVYIFDENSDGSFPAEVSDATIMFKEFDGKELSFEIDPNGDPEFGKMVITNGSGTFTADTEE